MSRRCNALQATATSERASEPAMCIIFTAVSTASPTHRDTHPSARLSATATLTSFLQSALAGLQLQPRMERKATSKQETSANVSIQCMAAAAPTAGELCCHLERRAMDETKHTPSKLPPFTKGFARARASAQIRRWYVISEEAFIKEW